MEKMNTIVKSTNNKLGTKALQLIIMFILISNTYAQEPFKSFGKSKKFLANLHEEINHQFTLYCGCPYSRKSASGGQVDRKACGVVTRINELRSKRIEWEHVVPASWFGKTRACWKLKDLAYPEECTGKNGRDCCKKVNEDFKIAYSDPNNLFPSVGEINFDRLNHPYGEVPNEPREYGECNAEILKLEGGGKIFEPAEGEVRGTVARAMLYMAQVYGVNVELPMDTIWSWHTNNPPKEWEVERAKRIAERTGLRNEWILGASD